MFWICAVVATVFMVLLVLLAIDLLAQEWRIRREAKEKERQRRLAYPGRHYLNEDQDTVVIPAAAIEAARSELKAVAA